MTQQRHPEQREGSLLQDSSLTLRMTLLIFIITNFLKLKKGSKPSHYIFNITNN